MEEVRWKRYVGGEGEGKGEGKGGKRECWNNDFKRVICMCVCVCVCVCV